MLKSVKSFEWKIPAPADLFDKDKEEERDNATTWIHGAIRKKRLGQLEQEMQYESYLRIQGLEFSQPATATDLTLPYSDPTHSEWDKGMSHMII